MVTVHLFELKKHLRCPVEKFLHYFTPQRQENILRNKFTADRNRTIWAELLARSIIAKKISSPIEEIQIERENNGKPYVVDSRLMISLAHSANWVACSIGEVPSGVDVEEDFTDALSIAKNFFTTQEYNQIRNVDGLTRAKKFLSFWTIKESFAKFTGRGIDEDFNNIDALKILSGRGEIVGKNFFIGNVVAGICTKNGNLPTNFNLVMEIFL